MFVEMRWADLFLKKHEIIETTPTVPSFQKIPRPLSQYYKTDYNVGNSNKAEVFQRKEGLVKYIEESFKTMTVKRHLYKSIDIKM